MRFRLRLVALAALIAASALVYLSSQPDTPPTAKATIPITGSSQPEVETALPPQKPVAKTHAASAPVAEPIAVFTEWTQRYLAASPKERRALVPEGVRLAQARRPVFKQLIKDDPRRALGEAIPMVVRQQMPVRVLEQLEARLNGVAALRVIQGVPLPGDSRPATSLTFHEAEFKDGKTYRAYVYGQREEKVTWTAGASLNGVALDADFAVNENPSRTLEVGEIPNPDKPQVNICPVSGKTTASTAEGEKIGEDTPAVETATEVVHFCGPIHIDPYNQTLIMGEGVSGGAFGFTGILPSAPTPALGNVKVLAIPMTYADQNTVPSTEAALSATFRDVADFYAKASYGRISLVGVVSPPVKLPHNEAWYVNRDTTNGGDISGTSVEHQHAREEARKLGYDWNDYDCIVVRHNGGPGSYGGLGGGSSVWVRGDGVSLWAHEIGHCFGLAHSNAWNTAGTSAIGAGANQEYGDTYDIMGGAGYPAGHYNAQAKNQIKWLPSNFVENVTTSGVYRLYAFDQGVLLPDRRYAMTIVKDAQRTYWGEVRALVDTNPWVKNGMLLGWRYPNGSGSNLQRIDTTPGSPFSQEDAAISVGSTFSDTETGIHLTTIAVNDSPRYVDVAVNFGSFPGNHAPTLALAASATVVPLGATVTFTATANDVDGDTLAYSWQHFGDTSVKLVSGNSPAITRTFSTAGSYIVSCTVSDMKGGSTTRNQLITVGSGNSRFTISGRVTLLGQGLQDVVVTANGANGVVTDADGYYTIPNLAANTYTMTPLLYGYTFGELFNNSVTVGPNAAGADFEATATPVVTIEATVPNASEGPTVTNGRFTLTRTGDLSQDLVVNVNPAQGSATKGTSAPTGDYYFPTDYATGSQGFSTFTIPADSATLDVIVTPNTDTSAEGPETVILQLGPGNGYLVGPASSATVVINDDDTALPKVSVAATTVATVENSGAPAVLTFTRSGATTTALAVNYTVSGSATSGADFTALSGSVTIPMGAASTVVNVTPVNDSASEPLETITLSTSSNAAYLIDPLAASATVSIIDDDVQTVSVVATDPTATEIDLSQPGAVADTGTFVVTRTGDTTNPLTVYYALTGTPTTGTTALHGVDYEALPGSVTIPANTTQAAVTIIPRFDTIGEGPETVLLTLGAGSTNYILGAASSATITINDSPTDTPYIDVVNTASAAEPSTNGNFRFSVRGPGTAPLVVNYTLSGTATNLTDYNTSSVWFPKTSGTSEVLRGVWPVNTTNVWAVGDNGTVRKWDGNAWAAQTSSTTNTLRGVWGTAANSLWAVGDGGTILKFNGTNWTAQISGTANALHAIWGNSATSLWAVGENGTILRSTNGTTWTAQSSGTTNALRSVWGTAANSVWAAGDSGTILKFDGTNWAAQTSGTTASLRGVRGSGTSNVWAVGAGGTILKFNGTAWNTQTSPTTSDLAGVWAADTNNVWAVGPTGLMLRTSNSGTAWTPQVSNTTQALTAISGTSSSYLWTVGDPGTTMNFDSAAIVPLNGTLVIPVGTSVVDLPIRPVNDALVEDLETITLTITPSTDYQTFANTASATMWLRDDEQPTVYVDTQVGTSGSSTVAENTATNPTKFYVSRTGSTANALTVNYTLGGTATNGADYDSGAVWAAQASGTPNTLRGTWGSDAGNVWAVGDGGTILKWDGSTWSAQTSTTTNALRAVWGTAVNSIWAVGDGGTILKFNGTAWSAQTSGTTNALRGVWSSDANNVWAVGNGGTILKFNGTAWSTQTSGITTTLNAVWGNSATSVWAVGDSGTIRKWNGTAWATQTSGTIESLRAIWGTSATSLWAAGTFGTILRSTTGTTWATQTTNTTMDLATIWGPDASNLRAGGDDGTIIFTSNSGSTWATQISNTAQPLNSLRGIDANNVWAVGDGGTITNWNGLASLPLAGTVVIPAGALGVDLAIRPIDDAIFEGTETITFDFAAGAYGHGPGAVMYISDNETTTNTVSFASGSAAGLEGVSSVNVPVSLVNPATGPVTVDYAVESGTRASSTTSVSNITAPSVTIPYWVRVTRNGNIFRSYASSDGVTWTPRSASQTIAIPATSYLAGILVNSGVSGSSASATLDNVSVTDLDAGGSVGAKVSADVGTPSPASTDSLNAGVYSLSSGGPDFASGTTDTCRYVYFPISNSANCTITARIVSITGTPVASKAGVMIRESTANNVKHCSSVAVKDSTFRQTYRITTGTAANVNSSTNFPIIKPWWVRLQRAGNVFTASQSSDGTTWTTVGSPQTMALAPGVLAGLAVSARNDNTVATATFDNVSLTGSPTLAGRTVGYVNTEGSSSVAGSVYTVSAAGAQIGGTEDECHFVAAPVSGNFTLVARVLTQSGGNSNAQAGVMVRESANYRMRSLYFGCVANAGTEFIVRDSSVSNAFGSGVDYLLKAGTLSFAIGEQTKNITLAVTNDSTVEGPNNVTIVLRNPGGATLGPISQFTYTILDDDTAAAVPYAGFAAAGSSVSEAAGTTNLLVTLSAPAPGPVSLDYAVTGGTATSPADYTLASGTVSFAAGQSVKATPVTIVQDTDVESNETVVVTLSNPSSAQLSALNTHTLTITDDDFPTVTIAATDASATESGDPGTFTIMRLGSTAGNLTVNYTIATGTGQATNGTDYTLITTSAVIPDGQTSATVTISPQQDTTNEGNETVTLTLATDAAYTLGASVSATVTIADDDRSTVTIVANDANASETAGNPGQFTVTRTAPTTASLTVNLSISGTATNGTDYANIASTVTIAANQTSAVINVSPVDDAVTEGPEDVTIALASGNYDIGTANFASVTIADNDNPPVLFISTPASQGPLIANGNGIIVGATVTDDGAPQPVTLTWSQVAGSGTATIESPNSATTAVTFSTSGTYVLRVTATDGQFTVSDQTTVVVGNALVAANWITQDLGPSSARRGQGLESSGTFSVSGTGAGYASTTADQAHVMVRSVDDDSSIVARLTTFPTTAALAGVTMRDTMARAARRAVLGYVPGTGLQFRTRTTVSTNDTVVTQPGVSLPVWVRLVRNATTNEITASYAPDVSGSPGTWTDVAPPTMVTMDNRADVGLTTTSNSTSTTATAVFDQVTLTPTPSGPALLSEDYGTAPPLAGSGGANSGTYTLAGSTSGYYYGWQYYGDLMITVKHASATSGAGSATSGIRISENLESGAYVQAGRIPTGAYNGYFWRSIAGGSGGGVPSFTGTVRWIRIIRKGNSITAFHAADVSGSPGTWAQIGQPQTVIMTTPIFVSFWVDNASGVGLNTVTFNNLSIVPLNNAPNIDLSALPSVSTGPSSVTLDATVTDDGSPTPSTVTTSWSKSSGPGSVIFGTTAAIDTSATFSQFGNYALRLRADDSGIISFRDKSITYYESQFQSWQAQHFSGNPNDPDAAPDADGDHDGFTTFMEYAFNLSTSGFDVAPWTLDSENVSSQNYLRLTVPKNPAATDVTYEVQATSNLADPQSWSSAGLIIEQDSGTTLRVRDSLPMGSTPRFMRAKVSR